MKTVYYIIIFVLIAIIFAQIFYLLNSSKKILIYKEINNFFEEKFFYDDSKSILFLGKMGQGYKGGENTDSIFLLHIRKNKAYIIHIPRDLIVKIDDGFYKINSLYSLNKIDFLLKEISNFTGLKVENYIVFDMFVLKKTIDALGGLEVELKYPVTDAITGYTLPSGKHKLNGEWVEFVVRSRYYPQGDFTRMENQFIIIKSLKERLKKLSTAELLNIINVFISSKNHFQTNLNYPQLISFVKYIYKIKDIEEINFDLSSNLWQDGFYFINIDNSFKVEAYGLLPKNGTGEYSIFRKEIKKRIFK
jgi:LCP family protein required for cell wall assembly